MTPATRRRLWRSFALAGLTLLALMALPASPASAHAVLVSSSPGANAVLPSPPAEIVLTFSESVRKVPDRIRVIGPDGSRVDRGEPRFDGAVVTITVDQGGARGSYLVSYRVISADGHPVSGGYTYAVGAPSTTPSDTGSDRTDPAVSTAVKVVKYLGYAGLVLVAGPALVLGLLWPHRLSRRGPARLLWAGVAVLAVATLAEMWLQVPYTAGGGLFDVDGRGLGDVLNSGYGATHLVRLGVLAAAAFLLRTLTTGRHARTDLVLLAILGVVGVLTWPLAGHPAASPAPTVSILADTVHLGSMALWLGGLAILAGFLLRLADDRELGAILPIWSRWATVAVCALLLAGTVQALIEVGTVDALVSTTYGRLVLAKVGLFALAIGAAAYSRQLVRQRAGRRPGRMRGAVWAELGITAVVLAVSATLVQTTPARTAAADAETGSVRYFSTTLSSSIYQLQVEVDPAEVGSNSVHLYAYTPDNKPLPVVEWRATAALPDKGVEPVEIPLLPLTDNHVTGEVRFPAAGNWQLRFTVRISEIDQATVSATVPIK
ncbi:MAG TPA: copper resistance protein CopC [Micromonosporaceae bacterium]|nr:copper resistance protein CopC [Micromonosporaceae bacterium]